MLDLVIVSGASKGIGLNIVKDLSIIANTIIGIGSSDKINNVELPSDRKSLFVPCRMDLTNYDDVEKSLGRIMSCFNPSNLSIVLCGASIGEFGGLFASNLSEWNKLYKCNVLGNLAVIKACEKYIKTIKSRIVFMGGGGGAFGYTDFSGYALTKAATVRTVENIGMEFDVNKYDASIIALAPGAVDTDILTKILASGGTVRTRTSIEEPTNFVRKFLLDEFDSKNLNGRFVHVRDDMSINLSDANPDLFKLRRIQ